jgi:hypothetical protein
MPSTGSFELSLINDAPSPPRYAPLATAAETASSEDSAATQEASHGDSFEGLDCGLSFGAGESETAPQEHAMPEDAADDYGELYDQPAHRERHVTFMMAALVLVACLTAGAAAAAFVFTAG